MKSNEILGLITRLLLGLLMLVPGLLKLFVMKPETVAGMFEGLGLQPALFWVWVVLIFEIVTGLMIIFNWQLKWAVIPPAVIILVAAFTASLPKAAGGWPLFIMHLAVVSTYLTLGWAHKKK